MVVSKPAGVISCFEQQGGEMNLFQRHPNYTLTAVSIGTFLLTMTSWGQGHSVISSLVHLVNSSIDNELLSRLSLPIWLALMLPVEGWALRNKKRSMWHLLWGMTTFGWIIILCLGSPKIDGNELQECLAYLETETEITAFQTREADLYNNTLVKYGNSIVENPLAASEVSNAAKRLMQASAEVLRRHEAITSVPKEASLMQYAWHTTFQAYAAWAIATTAAMEATAEGMTPHMEYVEQLFKEQQKAWRWAQDEEKKFLKRLKVNPEEIAKIITRATTVGIDDDWDLETGD
ncbi:MAG: hypothetical protein Q8P44_05895 [Dehalococcoidia bacterium]|nr:hypothetical protein [Dehalococcoidia bacterium]